VSDPKPPNTVRDPDGRLRVSRMGAPLVSPALSEPPDSSLVPSEMMSPLMQAMSTSDMSAREMMLWNLVIRLQIENMAMRNILICRHIITEGEMTAAVAVASHEFEAESMATAQRASRREHQTPNHGQPVDPRRGS
jgi:hypothetical protein